MGRCCRGGGSGGGGDGGRRRLLCWDAFFERKPQGYRCGVGIVRGGSFEVENLTGQCWDAEIINEERESRRICENMMAC